MKRLQLLKTYRGYKRGDSIEATEGVAAYLIGRGIAAEDKQRSLSPIKRSEAAIAATAAETR